MPPAIPDRWTSYKACGKVIDRTRIICFKVPLRKTTKASGVLPNIFIPAVFLSPYYKLKNVQRNLRTENIVQRPWDIKTLLKTIPKLGGVIDLTNTDRYYNPQDLVRKGILYKKILMPGRIIPPEAKVTLFMNTVDEFLQKDDKSLVGVHCTHGLNRTGYMVCRYMRDRLGFTAKDAIKDFQKARGYVMEREVYIANLLGTAPSLLHLPKDATSYFEINATNDKSSQDDSNRSQDYDYRYDY